MIVLRTLVDLPAPHLLPPTFPLPSSSRGLSSTVRKCVSRDTGQEYAVKIIDKSQDEAITESIATEKRVLSYLPQHKHISEWTVSVITCLLNIFYDLYHVDQCFVKIGRCFK